MAVHHPAQPILFRMPQDRSRSSGLRRVLCGPPVGTAGAAARCDAQDLLRALARLSPEQREALLLVVAEGLSYEEAAQVCGVAIGTIKSRINRARERLAQLLALDDAQDLGPDQVTQAALQRAI